MAESDDCDRPAEPSHEDLVDSLRLSLISGVGPRIRQALLERFGSARAALAAAPASCARCMALARSSCIRSPGRP